MESLPLSVVKLIISSTDGQLIRRLALVSTQNHGTEPPPLTERLGYLLKHAQLRFYELSGSALAPLGISGPEAAVLRAIDDPDPLSQGDVARRMRIDRTTMVALIDDL
jgi:hypothetical protein